MAFEIFKHNETIYVLIMKHKEDGKYSFVNITKQHICPCKFDTVDDAIAELDERVKMGKIIKYIKH